MGEEERVLFWEPNKEQRSPLCRPYTSFSLAHLWWCTPENVTSRQGGCLKKKVVFFLSTPHKSETICCRSITHPTPTSNFIMPPSQPNRTHTGFHCYLVACVQPPRWPFQLLCVVQQMCFLKQIGEKNETEKLWLRGLGSVSEKHLNTVTKHRPPLHSSLTTMCSQWNIGNMHVELGGAYRTVVTAKKTMKTISTIKYLFLFNIKMRITRRSFSFFKCISPRLVQSLLQVITSHLAWRAKLREGGRANWDVIIYHLQLSSSKK